MNESMNETEKLMQVIGLTEAPPPKECSDDELEVKAKKRRAKYEARLRELARARLASWEEAMKDYVL